MVRQTIYTFIIFLVPFFVFGQRDTIIQKDNFIIYLTASWADTLNRFDSKGKQGKWIEYDTSMVYQNSISIHKDEEVNSYSATTRSAPFCSYKIKWAGYYFDNKKQGLWTDSYTQNPTRKEFFYKDGILQSPVLYYLRGHLDTFAQYDSKKKLWKILRLDSFGKIEHEFFEKDIQFIIDF